MQLLVHSMITSPFLKEIEEMIIQTYTQIQLMREYSANLQLLR